MAGIYSALGELDRMRKMAGRRVNDLVKDPLGVLTQQADALRNTQMGLDPVINAAGAGMRQIPREEQVSRMTEQALDTYAGGLGMLGHTVFHGSPHKFSKFDKAKIGTGEGNQAFGHGLYVAEDPAVARSYARDVTGQKIRDASGRASSADRDATASAVSYWEAMKRGEVPRDLSAKGKPVSDSEINKQISLLTKELQGKDRAFGAEHQLYKIDIPDEAVPKMLDWDKPLKDQPPGVRNVFPLDVYGSGGKSLGSAMKELEFNHGVSPSQISDLFAKQGIPGIKYLDAGSREGGGTSNMVVFSPEMMRILERNGEATGTRPWAAGEWGGAAPSRPLTEFEQRHLVAQRNAALPVEQGGLGLGPQNTAMERAAAMGFEGGWAHGSPKPDITELRSSKIGAEGRGAYATDYAPEAGTYAGINEGATNYPLMVNRGKTIDTGAGSDVYSTMMADTDEALSSALREKGIDSITATQPPTPQWVVDAGAPAMPSRRHFVSENPSNFRSPFSAFDPARRHEADMLGFASPQLLGGMGLGGAGMAAYGLQDDQEGIFSRLGQYLRQRGMQ